MPRQMRQPRAASWAAVTPLAVPRVPTGMKTGQGTGPCGSRSSPARARLRPHSAVIRSSGAGPGPIALGAAIFPLSHVTHASGRPCVPPEVAVTGGNAAAMLGLRPLRWASVGARRGAGGNPSSGPRVPQGEPPPFLLPVIPGRALSPPRRGEPQPLLSCPLGGPPPLVPMSPRERPLFCLPRPGESPLPWSLSPPGEAPSSVHLSSGRAPYPGP